MLSQRGYPASGKSLHEIGLPCLGVVGQLSSGYYLGHLSSGHTELNSSSFIDIYSRYCSVSASFTSAHSQRAQL